MGSKERGQIITGDFPIQAQWPSLDAPPASPVSSASTTTSSSAGRTSHTSSSLNSRHIFRPSQKHMSSTRYTMWIGNIPSDATEEEILTFCRQPFPGSGSRSNGNGVLSVFLISYTNCAFVNFDCERSLLNALRGLNQQSLHPHDPECLPLVCKLRTEGDERHAGVNLQRGTGLHVDSVNAKRRRRRNERLRRLETIDATRLASYLSDGYDDEDDNLDSNASTTSSLLRENFQTRYFILKASDEASSVPCESSRSNLMHYDRKP
jgi:RNA recognition motif-containing protein